MRRVTRQCPHESGRNATMWRHPEFARGARDMIGMSLGIAAWGLVTGVAMAKSGLAMPLALLMSLIVFAGSAQLAALPLMAGGAPVWVVWATALCVNLRFVIFSARLAPLLRPPAAAPARAHGVFRRRPQLRAVHEAAFPSRARRRSSVPYFWGGVATNWTSWQLPSLVGHPAGRPHADVLGAGLRRHAGAAGAARTRCSPTARPGSPPRSPAAPRWRPMRCR